MLEEVMRLSRESRSRRVMPTCGAGSAPLHEPAGARRRRAPAGWPSNRLPTEGGEKTRGVGGAQAGAGVPAGAGGVLPEPFDVVVPGNDVAEDARLGLVQQ